MKPAISCTVVSVEVPLNLTLRVSRMSNRARRLTKPANRSDAMTRPGDAPASTETEGLTLEQVGQVIGVTKERVRQIQNKALEKIRTALQSSNPDAAVAMAEDLAAREGRPVPMPN